MFLYKKGIQGKVIESVASENVLFLIYHPEKKLVFAEWIQGVNEQEVLSEQTVTVISGEEAVAQAQLYFSQQNQSDIVINSARLPMLLQCLIIMFLQIRLQWIHAGYFVSVRGKWNQC